MRTFLRLDFLYSQAVYHNERGNPWGSRAAVSSLLDILAIMGRGDVRSDVLKELEHHLSQLNEFQNRPGIDTSRLRAVVANLTRLRGELGAAGSNWLQPLRDSEFLSAIKHRSAIPGGHLRVRPAGLLLLAQSAAGCAHRGILPLAGTAATAV